LRRGPYPESTRDGGVAACRWLVGAPPHTLPACCRCECSVTAQRAPETRTVTVERARWNWAPHYFDALIGVRIAFLEDDGSPARGMLCAVSETDTEISLTLSEVGPEA
jgi:hypothetical protein